MVKRDTGNRTTFWQYRPVPGISLLRADFCRHDYTPHTHNAFVIAITESGGAEICNASVTENVGSSTLFISNPEERQSARMASGGRWRYRAFYISPAAMDEMARNLGLPFAPLFDRSMLNDRELIERFSVLHHVMERHEDRMHDDESAIKAFSLLFNRYAVERMRSHSNLPPGTTIRKLQELIEERHTENLTLDELARSVEMTSYELIGLFKRSVGLTPHAYLVKVRLNAACRYMRRGQSITESALAAGFYDQSALNKHFKRSYGITPLQYAVAARAPY